MIDSATWLALAPLLPLAGFVLLALARLPRAAIAAVGAGSVALSLAAAVIAAAVYVASPLSGAVEVVLWRWMDVAGFAPAIGLRLDALSTVFILVITGVGLLIHVYSIAFMAGDEGYRRYFACMNLFIASMLLLVLADNLLLLYLGWEGVGLCSYLLIGFWYRDEANGRAARKAFIVTRFGDAAFAVGLFLLFQAAGTLDIHELLARIKELWSVGDPQAVAAGLLLLAGAVGKSAQLPLQTWLPDAMAGPTPVSALIHAATMVTAGVYLVARMNPLFDLAPAARSLVAVIGCATMLLAGLAALAQKDFKRVLAYSTISQIGYMFLALGVGAYVAGVAHFVTHALFKSALFLGAGIVIHCLHDGHDIFSMGGLRRAMPGAGWAFLLAALSLASVPPLTATFNSKDMIVDQVWRLSGGGVLWAGAILGTFLTAAYASRLFFVAFCGPLRQQPCRKPPMTMLAPFAALALLGALAGLPDLVAVFTGENFIAAFLGRSLPALGEAHAASTSALARQALLVGLALAGIGTAYVLYLRKPGLVAWAAATPLGSSVRRLAESGFAFDWLYDRLLVRPFLWLCRINRRDVIDAAFIIPARVAEGLCAALSLLQTGRLRWYAACAAAGAIIYLAVAVLT